MNTHPLMISYPFTGCRTHFQAGVAPLRSQVEFFSAYNIASGDRGSINPGEVHCDTLPPTGAVHGLSMDLEAAHPKHLIAGQAPDVLTDANRSAERRSRHDDAMALENKDPIHRQTKISARRRFAAGF